MPSPQVDQQDADQPDLAVIIAVGSQRERAARALRSLLEQSVVDRMEILLYDLGPIDCSPITGADHQRVRLTRQTPQHLLSSARVDGIRNARAPIVLFMEEHCELKPEAAEAIIRAHAGPWVGVGGVFENANPGSGQSDVAFRMNYGRYISPRRRRGPTHSIPGQNSSFKREVLLRYNDELDFLMHTDLVLQLRMVGDGLRLFHEPDVQIAHLNENSFGSLSTGVFYWNWCFSHVRARGLRWSISHKAVRLALAPLIPWWRALKILVRIFPLGLPALFQYLRDLPFVVGMSYCAMAGQVVGLLRNDIDKASRAFSHFEMNEPRLRQMEAVV